MIYFFLILALLSAFATGANLVFALVSDRKTSSLVGVFAGLVALSACLIWILPRVSGL